MIGLVLRKWAAFKKFMKYDGNITQLTVSQIQYPRILEGRKIIVTGGSDGIGFAIAKKCYECGASVLITGRNSAKLEKAATAIGPGVYTVVWDVADMGIIKSKVIECVNLLGG